MSEKKPLAGAVRAARATPGGTDGDSMDRKALIIERESGLRELVEAVEAALSRGEHSFHEWADVLAALRRVKEGP